MPTATEVAFLKLRSGLNPLEPDNSAKAHLDQAVETIRKQKGCLKLFYGVEEEDPTIFVFVIDWADISDHHNYMASDEYKDLIAVLMNFLDFDQDPRVYHAYLTHGAADPREAPVSEIVLINVPSTINEGDKSSFEDSVLGLVKHCMNPGKAKSGIVGWVAEPMPNEKDPSGNALGFAVVNGWNSVPEHIEITKDEAFQAIRKAMLTNALPPPTGLKPMRHIKLHSAS